MTGRVLLAVVVVMVLVIGACSSGEPSTGSTVPHTGPALELAPSQLTASTAPPPELPPLCDPDEVVVETALAEGGAGGEVGQPDQIVEFVNGDDVLCVVDLGATWGAMVELEPNVRLAPGGVGQLWLEVEDDCDETLADPQVELWLDVNGVQRVVDLLVVAPCGVEFVAFFPV